MGIRLTPKFNIQIDNFVNNELDKFKQVLLKQFIDVGEQFVADARDMGAYNNQTGNLRSSIGYVVSYDGEIIEENFELIAGTENGNEGVKAAEKLTEEVADGTKGFQLIVVAGMNYGAAVESKGFDVLSGASLIAAKELKFRMKLIEKIISK